MQPRLSFSLSRGAGSPRPRELSRRLGPRCPSRHAVSHQILQLIRIIDVENLMVELVDKHHVLTLPEAFFPTLLMANTRTLSAALRVANPAFFPFILGRAGFCRREYGQRRHEKQHTTNRGYLFHLSSPDVQKRSSQNTLAK